MNAPMGGHLGELLDARVDGELTVEQEAVVDAHVATCPACRAELEATERVKRWVADLPDVAPPFGFFEKILHGGPRSRRQRWPMRLGAMSLAATASIWFGVIGLARMDGSPPGVPALSSFVNRHMKTAPPAERAPAPRSARDEAEALGLPDELTGGYQLYRVVVQDEQEWALYTDYTSVISVFVSAGELDPLSLPDGSELLRFEGQLVWLVPSEAGELVVAQRGDSVVVVVGPVLTGPSVAEDVEPPSIRDSISDHIEAAGRGLFEAFGLG
jgi:hypothetical protein